MSLLPPNASKLERNLEKAIDYKVGTDVLSGFKFKTIGSSVTLPLAWEYSLAQVNIDDFQERILKGLAFHRICGTPASLRNALSWYNFYNIIIEEEPTGEHFAEFQIGLSEIPNSFGVDAIVSTARLAAPLRSRLSRMYNSLYDVRRFMLDGSKFGDFLSDHSGIRLQNNGPKLSFGRENSYKITIPEITSKNAIEREHFIYAKNADTYKLDFANLDDAAIDIVNHKSVSFPMRYVWNTDAIGNLPQKLFDPSIIAKAAVVLSDSILDDINSNLSAGYEKITEEPFIVSFSLLSQHKTTAEQILVEERFFRENICSAISALVPSVSESGHSRNCVAIFQDFSAAIEKIHARNHCSNAQYQGSNTWHDHRHFDMAWTDQSNYTEIT
ncbi:MAG: hypothetical protein LBT50_00685 [Prevotellaceae bacterium]|jgi:P2-related tail formation protein|nr:hypothetical protein [Prevotellaceae bacterium]